MMLEATVMLREFSEDVRLASVGSFMLTSVSVFYVVVVAIDEANIVFMVTVVVSLLMTRKVCIELID